MYMYLPTHVEDINNIIQLDVNYESFQNILSRLTRDDNGIYCMELSYDEDVYLMLPTIEAKIPTLEFVSYDGVFPNLCGGTLIMKLNGVNVQFPSYCLSSGGSCGFNDDYLEEYEYGEWSISVFPDGFPNELKEKADELVNQFVPYGCCVGCLQ